MDVWEERQRSSPATYFLIATNVIVWILTSMFSENVYREIIYNYGAIPILVVNGINLHTLITHMFLHADIIHIFLNMYMLFLFGRDAEMVMGTRLFLILYFISGLAGVGLHILYYTTMFPLPTTQAALTRCFRVGYPPCIPSIGASGAIFGVMASYAILFPTRRLFVFLGLFIPVAAPAIVIVFLLALIQILYMLATPFSTIAFTAHVGGFLAGLVISLLFRLFRGHRRSPEFYWTY